jgi:hypothetical protein
LEIISHIIVLLRDNSLYKRRGGPTDIHKKGSLAYF